MLNRLARYVAAVGLMPMLPPAAPTRGTWNQGNGLGGMPGKSSGTRAKHAWKLRRRNGGGR